MTFFQQTPEEVAAEIRQGELQWIDNALQDGKTLAVHSHKGHYAIWIGQLEEAG
jgi:hypothetical protein